MKHFNFDEEARKNLLFATIATIIGIANILIGIFVADQNTNDPMVYICSGIFLLIFIIWFVLDTLFICNTQD